MVGFLDKYKVYYYYLINYFIDCCSLHLITSNLLYISKHLKKLIDISFFYYFFIMLFIPSWSNFNKFHKILPISQVIKIIS